LHSIYHEHINISNITSNTQYIIIYVETQMGENHIMIFLYIKEYIHWKHQLSNSSTVTGRRLQPPIYRLQPEGSYNSLNSLASGDYNSLNSLASGGYNPLILRLQPERSSNSLCFLAPTRRRLQPPFLALSYCPDI
jgi:hypothetical protein